MKCLKTSWSEGNSILFDLLAKIVEDYAKENMHNFSVVLSENSISSLVVLLATTGYSTKEQGAGG